MRSVFALVCFLLWLMPTALAQVMVKDVQLTTLSSGSQLVLDLTAATRYDSFLLDNPPRLVVDLYYTRLSSDITRHPIRSPDVHTIRTGIHDGVDLRVVLDLTALMHSEVYLLQAITGSNQHLVMDIYRHEKPSPDQIRPSNDTSSGKSLVPASGSRQRDIIIAIDPGHGGKDPGAIGPQQTYEKNIVLNIAKHLQRLVNREPGMRAILTRNQDTYLRLYQRIAIARQHRANLFVSIHADAFNNQQAHGSSVFILSTQGASSAAARWLAQRENEADLMGGDMGKLDDELKPIIFDIYHDAILADSLKVANKVLTELGKVGKLHKGYVERAGFAVLKAPDIPSVLIETAFISNPEEEIKLRQKDYQHRLAKAIMKGIRAYFRQYPPRFIIAANPAATKSR